MTCPECGTELLQGARYCHHCGWDSKLAAAGKASSQAADRPAWKRWLMSGTLGVATMLMLVLLVIPRGEATASLIVGQEAPEFDLESLSGERVRLSELQGKPLVVNFWASWCTPCIKEMPDFQEVLDKYQDQGLQIYGINVGESKVAVANFQQRVGVSFPMLLDLEDRAQMAYKILPLPATFFIDKDGVIRGIYQYQMSKNQIEREVLRLLETP